MDEKKYAMAKRATGPKAKGEKKITRFACEDINEPGTLETGHAQLLLAEEQVLSLPMDNGWSKAVWPASCRRVPRGRWSWTWARQQTRIRLDALPWNAMPMP
jgi:hypothetical protein